MNFNKIFRKNVTCDNIKIHKNQVLTLSLKSTISEKPQEEGFAKLNSYLSQKGLKRIKKSKFGYYEKWYK